MNSKLKRTAGVTRKNRSSILPSPLTPLQPANHNGEYTIDFNKYLVVYSNNVSGNLHSPWRAGATVIECYQDENLVGSIMFYETSETFNGGTIDANGVAVIEYPIRSFQDVMRVLKTFSNLSLLFIDKDPQGKLLAHPLGAVMTFEKKPTGA